MEGKWSLGVELGVSHTEALVVALSGKYRLAGAVAPLSMIGDSPCEEIEREGP
jgi:hypothetical protein